MQCKNCGNTLRRDFSYCPVCGAKVIKNRLTLKNIWQDLSFQVFNLDNTLLKTIRYMFTQPEVVITGFISGARKKFMNPVSYFAIAITLSGVLIYVLRNWYDVRLTEVSGNSGNTTNMDFIFDYQGLMSYLIMPIYALMTWILFLDKRTLNYSEHLVANAYTTAQVSFVQVVISLPLFGFFEIDYQTFNWFFLLFSVSFQFYVFKRLFGIGLGSTLIRALGYLIMFAIIFMAIGIVVALIAFTTGQLNPEDFKPK